MDPGTFITLLWLAGGIALVGSELLHASLTTVFLGIAAMMVAGMRALGLVDALPASLIAWSVLSVGLTVPLRPLMLKWFPGERRHDSSGAESDTLCELVDVIEMVSEDQPPGRIRFQGTSWPATCIEGTIPAGGKARIVYREKLAWVVEPLPALEAATVVPIADPRVATREKTEDSSGG